MPSTVSTQWLLDCLKQPQCAEADLPSTLHAVLDWAAIVQLADQHGVTPLLYARLQQRPSLWSSVPAAVQTHCQQRYLDSAYRNLQLYQHGLTLLKALRQAGLAVIVLKGVYLAYTVYGDRALRPMADVDILVKHADVPAVEAVLQASGYTLSDWKHRTWCLRNHYHLSYWNPITAITIEVHWHIQRPTAPYPINVDVLWQQAQPVTMVGVQTQALSHEHLVLHHSLHIAKHGFAVGLRPFCDLAIILAQFGQQINWSQVQAEAQRWRINKALYLALYFTHEFLGAGSAELLATLKPALLDPAILITAREQILTLGSGGNRLSTDFLQLWENESGQNKLMQLVRRLFLPPDLMSSIYGMAPDSWLVYLYYPVRLVDLLLRYPALTRRLLRRDAATLTLAQRTTKVDTLREWLAT
ncbi:MAG: nucleotidyltransferase family protein [Caldilineaceae bacterium]